MSEQMILCNFRVNSKLKSDFSALCKMNHSTVSYELRAFISRSIQTRTLNYDAPSLTPYGQSNQHSHNAKVKSNLDRIFSNRLSGGDNSKVVPINSSEQDVYHEEFKLDSSCNFKLESDLKDDFLKTFPGANLSAELKRFMSHIVRKSK